MPWKNCSLQAQRRALVSALLAGREAVSVLCRRFGVSRADQGAWSAESHRRAIAARTDKKFEAEIVPIAVGDCPEELGDGRTACQIWWSLRSFRSDGETEGNGKIHPDRAGAQ